MAGVGPGPGSRSSEDDKKDYGKHVPLQSNKKKQRELRRPPGAQGPKMEHEEDTEDPDSIPLVEKGSLEPGE
eukprot:15664654-Heterocapsa_arctica.AAC.1